MTGRSRGSLCFGIFIFREQLLKRVITACVLIPAVLFILFYTSVHWFVLVALTIGFISLLEFNALTRGESRSGLIDSLTVLAGLALPAIYFLTGQMPFMELLLLTMLFLFLAGMLTGIPTEELFRLTAMRTFGVIYIGLPITFLIAIRVIGTSSLILFMLVIIWVNDSAAYFVGRAIGKRKLCPSLSPGKTIEGAIGGIAGGIIAGFIYVHYSSIQLGFGQLLLLCLLIGVAGIIGDLAESAIKRSAGAKDSGSIIPGHGGLLDRIDSMLFVLPVLYFFWL
jgi:phosphatidate cytidylyltransferase